MALQRLQALCRAGFISVLDFRTNPLRIFAAHEIAALCADGSLGTKMTVQFNLFGGSVLKLGTERHHGAFLKRMDNVDDIGCFALTELGYGNNAVEMETTAVWDQQSKEFIIHTPSTLAQARSHNLHVPECRSGPLLQMSSLQLQGSIISAYFRLQRHHKFAIASVLWSLVLSLL